MAGGGVFPNSSSSLTSRYATVQPKFVANGGLLPEAKATGSCSLIKCNSMDVLTDGSTRCEASSRYPNEVLAYNCRDPSSSTVAAEDQLVLDPAKTSSNGTLFMLEAFKASSWNRQKPAYMNIISCTNQNPHLPNPNAQRALKASVNTTLQETSHEFKPDDASSHNMLSKSSGDLEMFSESITECLLQEDRADARQKEDRMLKAVKSSKRKAAEIAKNPLGIEVESERKSMEESRIVRVSRLTGGKDRHSKVRTAKGLRDRRVRLSVATAIQFYDLQDRLGLEQPSLAVDWLLRKAQSSIVELPVLDTDMNSVSVSAPAVDAGSNLASPSCSPVKYGESATAAVSVKNENKFSEKEMPNVPSKHSEVGKSSSSASDGSMMGVEYTSKSSSLSKLARLKEARERARKKSASAKIPVASPQTDSLDSSVPSQFMNVLGYRGDSLCGISNQVSTGHIQQQLWEYSTPLSYSDIFLKDSRQLQHMGFLGTSSTTALPQSMQSVIRSSYEMADSGITLIDRSPRERNSAQILFNLMHPYPTQQQQSQAVQKQFASTFAPTFTNDVSFSTCSRGPLQSNSSSCITNDPPPHQTQKNAYAEASTKVNTLPFHAYDARMAERFSSILEGNANYEANH